MHDKTATFGPSNVYVPGAGHAPTTGYAGGHLLGGPAAHGSSRTGPLAAPPHPPSVLPLGATAPVGGGGRPLPGAGGAPAGLTAANLSLLEQSIPAAAKAPPFGHPPAIRSKLSVEQGLQDALDSLIISGRPLMGRYTLDAASVRQITAKSVIQFASEVCAAPWFLSNWGAACEGSVRGLFAPFPCHDCDSRVGGKCACRVAHAPVASPSSSRSRVLVHAEHSSTPISSRRCAAA